MRLVTLLVTRSKSCHVKTLHTVMKLNIHCVRRGWANEIMFCNDDPFKKAEAVQKLLKTYDRIMFIDFGINVDEKTIEQVFETHDGCGCLVFPAATEGIDWGMFKKKVLEDSQEPVHQMGLHFDTEVGQKIKDDLYHVKSTTPRCWMMVCKTAKKKLGDTKLTNYDKMFEKLRDYGVKIYAWTAAHVVATYAHECVSNIMNAAGVRATA
jgi:hypothetical protein